MTLDSEDIIPRHRTGKGDAVIGGAGDASTIDRIDEIAVHEVKAGAVLNTVPQRV